MTSASASHAPALPSTASPVTAATLIELAIRQLDAKDFEGLLGTARQIARDFPKEPCAFSLMARALDGLGRADEIPPIMQQGLLIFPESSKLRGALFQCLIEIGRPSLLQDYINGQIIEQDTVSKEDLFTKFNTLMGDKDFLTAAVIGANLIYEYPGRPESFQLFAKALLCAGFPREAFEVVRKGMTRHSGNRRILKVGYHVAVQLCDREWALKFASEMVQVAPHDDKAQYWVFLGLLNLGRFDAAEKQLDVGDADAPNRHLRKAASHFRDYHKLKSSCPALKDVWEVALSNSSMPSRRSPCQTTEPATVLQYWSQGAPPSDIMLAVSQWNKKLTEAGAEQVTLFDRASAAQWIETYAPEFSEAFASAFQMAMEADIFRIAYAAKRPCIYIDIDSWPIEIADCVVSQGLASSSSTLQFRTGSPTLINGFFIAKRGCPFFTELARQCVALKPQDFFPQDPQTVLSTFGPTRYNMVLRQLLCADSSASAEEVRDVPSMAKIKFSDGSGLQFVNEFAIAASKPPFPLDYVTGGNHWKEAFWEKKRSRAE